MRWLWLVDIRHADAGVNGTSVYIVAGGRQQKRALNWHADVVHIEDKTGMGCCVPQASAASLTMMPISKGRGTVVRHHVVALLWAWAGLLTWSVMQGLDRIM